MTPVLRRTLGSERGALVGWVAGIGALTLVTAGSWPAVRDSGAELSQVLEGLPEAFTAFLGEGAATFSAEGIVGSRLFGSIGLALFISFAVSRGARAIAGEEEDGTLELLVTQPLSRTAIAVDKVIAGLGSLGMLVTVQMVLLMTAMPIVGLEFPLRHVVAASVGLYLLSAMFGMLAFAVGAATGKRPLAIAVAAGTAAALFLLSGLGALIDAIRPLTRLSPFDHFDGTLVLSRGITVLPIAAFGAIAVSLAALGILAFDRRDLS